MPQCAARRGRGPRCPSVISSLQWEERSRFLMAGNVPKLGIVGVVDGQSGRRWAPMSKIHIESMMFTRDLEELGDRSYLH